MQRFVGSLFPGAVLLIARDGAVLLREAYGDAVRYSDGEGTELPAEQRVPMTPTTIFDLASISKLFTSIVIMQLVEQGAVALDAPVRKYLSEFGPADSTVRQLLTHTSGFPAWLPLWRHGPDRAARIAMALSAELESPPDTRYVYSDLNLIVLGVLAERISGVGLETLVRDGITEPLGMTDTGYCPSDDKLERIAATEFQPDTGRGMVRGSVHDENAWSLGGVAGHAGIFGTADDLATLGQAFLDNGRDNGRGGNGRDRRILRSETVEAMLTDHNVALGDGAHGLGFDLDRPHYMGVLSSPRTAGHTGFTGTSIVIDPRSRCVVVLLTNRVHPRREWSTVNPARQFAAEQAARLL